MSGAANLNVLVGPTQTCCALLALGIAAAVSAQSYPSRPLRVVVPYAAGGSTDVLARLIGQKLTTSLGQSVIIDNRTGAGTLIATEIVAHAMLKVLVPVDGSKNCLRAVQYLIGHAALYKDPVEIHLLNVQRPFPGTVRGVREEAEKFHHDEGIKALADARKLLDDAGLKYAYHINVGEAAESIGQFVKQHKLDQVVMYLLFFLVATAGLMAIAQFAAIAKEYAIANTPVSIIDLTLPALTFALAIDRVFSGLTRPFFGWVSDRLGRELTMGIAFSLEAAAIVALAQFGHDPLWFVLLTGLIFFGWGEIYSLFPATSADTFGARYAATHAGLLYTAKGTAALVVMAFSAVLLPTTGWQVTFYCAAGMNALAAVLALFVLHPLRRRLNAQPGS